MATVHFVDAPDGWVGFGEWLRETREARGLTLDDITRETKIPVRNLEALEHGNLSAIPAFYQRAEVRAIARAVGVDEGLAVGRLDSAIAPVVVRPKPEVPRAEPRLGPGAVAGALALCALLVTATEAGRAMLRWTTATPPPAATLAAPAVVTFRPSTPVASLVTVPPAVSAAAQTAPATTDVPTTAVTALLISTEPEGAHVTVNGIGWGASPITISHLSPGEKHIRVTMEGFAATEQTLSLDEGQRRALSLRLRSSN